MFWRRRAYVAPGAGASARAVGERLCGEAADGLGEWSRLWVRGQGFLVAGIGRYSVSRADRGRFFDRRLRGAIFLVVGDEER